MMRTYSSCPSCDEPFREATWKETEVGCEDCGSHSAVECPKCGETYDLVYKDFQETNPMTDSRDWIGEAAENEIAEMVKAFNLSFAAPSLHAMLKRLYQAGARAALERGEAERANVDASLTRALAQEEENARQRDIARAERDAALERLKACEEALTYLAELDYCCDASGNVGWAQEQAKAYFAQHSPKQGE